MTASELLEQLRLLPPETTVLVEGYETGFDAVCLVRHAVARFQGDAHDWDGEYQELRGDTRGDAHAALVIVGRRGHLR